MTESIQDPHFSFQRLSEEEMLERSELLWDSMKTRRSVRSFRKDSVPLEVIRRAIRIAARGPSGANKQPWTFVLVTDSELKRQIREAAEEEERTFYRSRAPEKWLQDLEHLGTDEYKPFLEEAPALIVVFAQISDGEGGQHYYVKESVGIACGMLLTALQFSGLATLTHTPSPMKFLSTLLERPKHERPYLLIPVGYPTEDYRPPLINRKGLDEVLVER